MKIFKSLSEFLGIAALCFLAGISLRIWTQALLHLASYSDGTFILAFLGFWFSVAWLYVLLTRENIYY
jgi:hypothetical protein